MRRLVGRLLGRPPWPDFRRLPAVNTALAAHGLSPLAADPAEPDPVRLALAERLTGRRRLTDPGFADGLAARHPGRAAELRAACATGAGPAGRVYESRPDIRVALPFGLTAQQRAGLLDWMLGRGRHEIGFTPEQAVWAVVEAADRGDGLATLYRWNPSWQAAVPDGLSAAGWPRLVAHLAAAGLDPRAAGRRPPADPPTDLLVLSYFRNACGLQVEADAVADGLAAAGWRVGRRTLPGDPAPGRADPRAFADLEAAPVTLAKLGAAEPLADAYRRAGLHPRPGVYRVANLSWELDRFPAAGGPDLADEVWTPSRFCADACRATWPGLPVRAMPPGVTAPPVGRFDRAGYGLPAGRFLVLFVFDLGSVAARKNPLGLVRAFRRAFPPGAATLCLKVSSGRHHPAAVAELRAAGPDVVVLDRVMTRAEVGGLMAAADCYASLHRSEGFGLTLAEAMLLGKPVVATDYSATAEFVDDGTGLPVRCRLVPVGPGNDPYPADARWADPDEGHAAERLRWVYENPEAARRLGAAGRERVARQFDPAATAARMAARLREVAGPRGERGA